VGPRTVSKPAWKPATDHPPALGLRRASGTGSDPPRTSWKRLALPPRRRAPKSSTPIRGSASELRRAHQRVRTGSRPRLRGNARRPLASDRAPRSSTSSCRRSRALRGAPSRTDARPRHVSVETPHDLSPSAGLRGIRRRAAGSLQRSEERRGQPARDRATPPCERPSAQDDHAPRPEGRGTRPKSTSGPSRDPFTCPWNASSVRRPPRHPASLLPSPRTLPQTPLHLSTPKGTSVEEANTSRPCGPVDRHRERRATPKGSSSDLQPVSRSSGLITWEPSRRQAAPKSDSAKFELSAEPHGCGRTKRYTALGLRRVVGRNAASRLRARGDRPTALVTPRAPEGARGESAATA